MIDVHAHFADEGYDFPEEWNKIKAAGVPRVILAGDTLEHTAAHRSFCKEHDGAYFTTGIHPEHASSPLDSEDFEEYQSLCKDPKCVAVGEIGLDYHYEGFDKQAQHRLFTAQLALAKECKLPVQIHSRDACADTLAILREHKECLQNGFLMHCYSYGAENLNAFLQLGAYFSFGGVACFKNAKKVWESVAACPLDRLLSETDSPYLSPFRGEKNSPANIPVIVARLAELKGVSAEALALQIDENAKRLFERLK